MTDSRVSLAATIVDGYYASTNEREMWFNKDGKAFIWLRPISGGGSGWNVELQTRERSLRDFARETYHPDLVWAADRVAYLMGLVPGEWVRITRPREATPSQVCA